MSDNIPFEIQEEILKRLPVKSLIRIRSVSKPWKSLIDSSEFIKSITKFNYLRHTDPQHLLVSYNNNNEEKYVSILDDNTFPEHKFPLTPRIPVKVNLYIGCSQGLFCFCGNIPKNDMITESVVIWNPTIRKSVAISMPNVLKFSFENVIGFGVCPHTSDPKLVNITCTRNSKFDNKMMPSQVEICNTKSRVWRTISNSLPRESIELTMEHVAIDRLIYWHGHDINNMDDEQNYNLILLFDITNEEFTQEIYLPGSLGDAHELNLFLSKLGDSLVVLETDVDVENQVYDVWMMEDGVPNSFKKLYTIKVPNAIIDHVLGFRKTGEPLIDMITDSDEHTGLFVYESDTEHVSDIGIFKNGYSSFASSYVESLLLLDH